MTGEESAGTSDFSWKCVFNIEGKQAENIATLRHSSLRDPYITHACDGMVGYVDMLVRILCVKVTSKYDTGNPDCWRRHVTSRSTLIGVYVPFSSLPVHAA